MVIGRVENLADNLCHCVLLHRTHIIALVEHIHVKSGCLCTPKTENADALAVLARNEHIVGDSLYRVAVTLLNAVILAIPALVNPALEEDINSLFLMRNKPNLSARKPEIGQLSLPAVNKLLLKNAVFVEN